MAADMMQFCRMPDTRELILLTQMAAGRETLPLRRRFSSWIKLALRGLVVATSGSPLRSFYAAIYRMHVQYAVRALMRFPGTRAIYATRGMASGEIVYGVSDIDMVIIGEWTAEEHRRVLARVRHLSRRSPLYDSTLWQQVHTLAEVRSLAETDYFFQSRFHQGRSQWKLLAGDEVRPAIPAAPPERMAGGYYMELRNWWLHFIMSAFGAGPTARDAIFRNSICYKSAIESLNIAAAIEGGSPAKSRAEALAGALGSAAPHDRLILERLARSARRHHRVYEGDIQNDSLQLLVPLLERAHAALATAPVFQPASQGLQIDAAGAETLVSAAAREHARAIAAHARDSWPGYRSASLLPSVACFAPDDLLLLLEVDPGSLPHAREIQKLCRLHADARPSLPQRVALYLLLPHGAYQLDLLNPIEMWRVLLCPAANPDVFSLLGRPEFTTDGAPVFAATPPVWTVFANQLVNEELNVRRSAMAAVDPAAFPDSREIMRNIWRHLQLEIISRTTAAGYTLAPLTPAAIQRAFSTFGIPSASVLDELREAYEAQPGGAAADVRPLIPRLMAMAQSLR